MAYPAFPIAKCNYPVRENFNSGYGQKYKRTAMDDGHGRYRRQWDSQPIAQTLNWQLTWNQLTYFEGFLKYDCAQACGYFTLAPYPGGPTNTYRMTAYPEITFDDSNGFWQVAAQVEYIRTGPTGYAKPATLPVFPTTLPQPEKSGYGISRPDSVTRSNLTNGLATERARWLDETGQFKVSWILTAAEYAIWDNFVHNQLLGGLAPFLGWFANGKGTVKTRVRFMDTPQVTTQGAAFVINATCEIQQIPGISYVDYLGDAITLNDSFTYAEAVSFKISPPPYSDSITYSETVSFTINHPVSDSLTYTETTSLVHTGYTGLGDSVAITETINFTMTPAPLTDSFTFSATGGITLNDYVSAGYVGFGYVGTTTPFVN